MKRPHRRQFLHLAAGAAALPTLPHTARAQNYPARQITLIAPWPAGGAIDALCRAMAPGLAAHLGTSVIVENRPGASSVLGVATGARAAPDGYTLTMAGSASLAISVTLNRKLPYDPLKSFVPIAFTGFIPFILVANTSLPVHSLTDLIKYAKANPGKLSFASGGPGSPHHLLAELLKGMAGIEMTHVPYKGSAPALTDVIAGHVPLLFSDTVPSLPMNSSRQGARARCLLGQQVTVCARDSAARRSRAAGVRRRWVGDDSRTRRNIQRSRGQGSCGSESGRRSARRPRAGDPAWYGSGREPAT